MPKSWPDRLSFRYLLAAAVLGLAACAALPARAQTLAERLDVALGKSSVLAKTTSSLTVLHWPSGRVVYAHAPDRLLTPASNQKLVTAAAALAVLGPEYKLATQVVRNGNVEGGVLGGDLVVRGAGDPTLGLEEIDGKRVSLVDAWAEAIRRAGIRRVSGSVVVDDRIFDRQTVHPDWPDDQLSAWYCAQVAGLSYNDNCVDLTIRPGPAAGDPAIVEMVPQTDYVKLTVTARTSSSRPRGSRELLVHRRPGTNHITVSRLLWNRLPPTTHYCTVDDPSMFVGTLLKEALARKGIAVDKGVRRVRDSEPLYYPRARDKRVLAEHVTPMADVVRRTLVSSQNLYAECLLKLMGAETKVQGTFAGGAAQAASVVSKRLKLRGGQLKVSDGSGMSRRNAVSSRVLARLLLDAATEGKPAGKMVIDNLAVAGVNGTMKRRLADSPAKGWVFAKTGYLRGVVSRSGLVVTRGKHVYVFSFLVNDIKGPSGPVQKALDAACETIYLHGD